MDKLWNSLYSNTVPQQWLVVSYPTCRKNIGDYIKNLNERLDFINEWIRKGSKDMKKKSLDS